MIRQAARQAIRVIANPEKEFRAINTKKIEEEVRNYLRLLIAVGIFSAIINILWGMGKSTFYDLVYNIDIHYLRLFNYQLGLAVSILFFYIFAGTFLFFILSLIINTYAKMKYSELFKIMFYALSPLLLFSWVPYALPGLLIWSAALMIVGLKNRPRHKVDKNSIAMRD